MPTFRIGNKHSKEPFLITCEHASGAFPAEYDSLGLTKEQLVTISDWYDIGAEQITVNVCKTHNFRHILGNYCRLLVDLNRDVGHEELIRQNAYEIRIPGNQDISKEEVKKRLKLYYWPYHDEIERQIKELLGLKKTIFLISIHSFNHVLNDVVRDVDIGLLYRYGKSLPPLSRIERFLKKNSKFDVRYNEPYSGKKLITHTMKKHGLNPRITSFEFEINDRLLKDKSSIKFVSGLIADSLRQLKQ